MMFVRFTLMSGYPVIINVANVAFARDNDGGTWIHFTDDHGLAVKEQLDLVAVRLVAATTLGMD
jgi:hypothetical protein